MQHDSTAAEAHGRALRKTRLLLGVFIVGLLLGGVTAIPLETELRMLAHLLEPDGIARSGFAEWIIKIRDALIETNAKYPFIAYGTDWLAFAHFVIAIAFIGPWREAVRNVWVVEFGMIACVLVIPFALVMGAVREIPFGWRLIDCSFGLIGVIPLWLCRQQIQEVAKLRATLSPEGHALNN